MWLQLISCPFCLFFTACTLPCMVLSAATCVLVCTSGGSVANCFSDLWVLDLTHGSWSKPEVVGPSPTPRAGHGGVLVGDSWYILGGGNNVKGGPLHHAWLSSSCSNLVLVQGKKVQNLGAAKSDM